MSSRAWLHPSCNKFYAFWIAPPSKRVDGTENVVVSRSWELVMVMCIDLVLPNGQVIDYIWRRNVHKWLDAEEMLPSSCKWVIDASLWKESDASLPLVFYSVLFDHPQCSSNVIMRGLAQNQFFIGSMVQTICENECHLHFQLYLSQQSFTHFACVALMCSFMRLHEHCCTQASYYNIHLWANSWKVCVHI